MPTLDYQPTQFCGSPAAWLGTTFAEAPPIPLSPLGFSTCCGPIPPIHIEPAQALLALRQLVLCMPRLARMCLNYRKLPAGAIELGGPTPAIDGLQLAGNAPPSPGSLVLDSFSVAGGSLALNNQPVSIGSVELGPSRSAQPGLWARGSLASDWSVLLGTFPTGQLQVAWVFGGSQFQFNSGAFLNTLRYYHVALTWDLSTLQLYIDTAPDSSASAVGTFRHNTTGIFWGWQSASPQAEGSYAAVHTFSAALTPAQVLADAQGSTPASVVAAYPCNDGSGTTVTDTVSGANGTCPNGVTWTLDGPGGGGLELNNTANQFVSAPDTLSDTGPWSICFWWRPPFA